MRHKTKTPAPEAVAGMEITYVRSPRARLLRLTIRPDRGIIVTIPRQGTLEEAKAFLQSRTGWIQRTLHKIQQREQIQKAPDLADVDLKEAQNTLFSRLAEFSSRFNLPYRRAALRCQKTRWGSCSGQNTITLNINIVFLPPALQDYILLHELAHLKVKNHSKAFWSLLDSLCGCRAKTLARQLRHHDIKLKI
jgi:predicted metal-dependent hydrolase